MQFKLVSPFSLTGDQPQAVEKLVRSIQEGNKFQTLEGVTGSGKTFTIANVIAQINKPTLVISHNKTLAAQLYNEFKSFFPYNAVEYFVSYYDYYQPEAYIPERDLYIEKDASINEKIEQLRLSATSSLMSRRDVIIVASVSCIYGLGSPEDYEQMSIRLEVGETIDIEGILKDLIDMQYERNDIDFKPGTLRVRGDIIDVFPPYEDTGIRIELFDDEIEKISYIVPITGEKLSHVESVIIFPAKHFVIPEAKIKIAIRSIERELEERLKVLEKEGKILERNRLEARTRYDLEMLASTGYCKGIENYSRHFSQRKEGEPPYCLIDFFPSDFLTIIDESHVTIPQLKGMYNGDRARKLTLIEHGFRLPSALDNRPLKFEEFIEKTSQIIFMSATPSEYELRVSKVVAQQIIRPTGLVDPEIIVRPSQNQVEDIIKEAQKIIKKGERVLITTLTKRLAEELARFLIQKNIKTGYLHSEIDAIERVEILQNLREGRIDVLVGVNLLREGLDLPEVALVGILDADKEGFLRSATSLIQTIGRCARNVNGKVILYADTITDAIKKTIEITEYRRKVQLEYNKKHNITPRSIRKKLQLRLVELEKAREIADAPLEYKVPEDKNLNEFIKMLEEEMFRLASELKFEEAAKIRDKIKELRQRHSNRSKILKRG